MKARETIGKAIFAKGLELDRWFKNKSQGLPLPFYCSVDLRDSGYKIAPIDNNLYPAGFNNICPDDLKHAPRIFKENVASLASRCQTLGNAVKRVVILPENHTQNSFYIQNLETLIKIITDAGMEVRLGWYLGEQIETATTTTTAPIELTSASGNKLLAYPIQIRDGVLFAGDFRPDLVVLNNDFSSGYPKGLDPVTQPIVPNHGLGWHTRQKIHHFKHYNQLATEFAEWLKINPDLIRVDTELVTPVDFDSGEGVEKVASRVDAMLERITKLNASIGNQEQKPFVIVKNNAGTYGMGIMSVKSGEELLNMNRRSKNKMSVGKSRQRIGSVVVQEGMETAVIVDQLASEPVIYLMGCQLVGGFLRSNTERGTQENLNAKGMIFKKLCVSEIDSVLASNQENKRQLELVYGSLARLSALAAALEIKDYCGCQAC